MVKKNFARANFATCFATRIPRTTNIGQTRVNSGTAICRALGSPSAHTASLSHVEPRRACVFIAVGIRFHFGPTA